MASELVQTLNPEAVASIKSNPICFCYRHSKAEEISQARHTSYRSKAMEGEKNERKIVVAVDESEESMYALSWCISNLLFNTTNTKLVLLYVKPPPTVYSLFDSAGYIFSTDALAVMESYGKELATSVMQRAEATCRSLKVNNIKMERVVGSGDAKDVICSAVKKLKGDTLVMGTHGYGFFKRALLGSVSDHCAKYAKCPVVIVKHP